MWPRSHLCGLKDTRLRHLLGFVVAALGDHPDSVDWTRIALTLARPCDVTTLWSLQSARVRLGMSSLHSTTYTEDQESRTP